METKMMKTLAAAAFALGGLSVANNAAALDTKVQFSGTADSNYTVTGITSFDWQDTSSLVIDQTLVSATGTAGGICTGALKTLGCFFAVGVAGDTLSFNIYTQTILTGFTSGSPTDTDSGNLNSTGVNASATDYEITAALTGVETATLVVAGANPLILFTSITGEIQFFYDASPNANNAAGTGFTNGTSFLTAKLTKSSGTFLGGVGGSTFIGSEITSYNKNYIDADEPDCANPGFCLVGASFNSLIDLTFGVATPLSLGNDIGLNPRHTYVTGDLLLAADSTTQFSRVPEPGTLVLLGLGLLGLGRVQRRKA